MMEKPVRPVLDHPCGTAPATGETVRVAPGMLWVRMPLPLSINHINLWVIEDGDSLTNAWTIVDTGLYTPEIAAAWRALLADRRVNRVIVTHMHPDHVGMAGELTRNANCALWMTRLEYLHCRVLAADTGRAAPEAGVDFYKRAGWTEAPLARYQKRFGEFGRYVSPLPDTFRRLHDGENIRIGGHDWRVVVGTGHSPEHACLYCADLDVLISGDQVLPGISSNVSVFPTEPEADPLGDWLESIDRLKREIPDTVLVLPAHQEPFRGLHARLDHLHTEHMATLDRLRIALQTPKRVIDIFDTLFWRDIKPESSSLQLATGEAIACLNYLMRRQQATLEIDDNGVGWYSTT